MRLNKIQKEALLVWIAEGLRSDEINARAAEFDPPFSISRRQATYYRNTRKADIEQIIREGERKALKEGLATVERRVKRLVQLAERLEDDLLDESVSLWLPQVKSIGSGENAQVVDYEIFNRSEIEAYRGLLDDIARELGHRNIVSLNKILDIDLSLLTFEQLERIAAGEDPLHVLLSSIHTDQGESGA